MVLVNFTLLFPEKTGPVKIFPVIFHKKPGLFCNILSKDTCKMRKIDVLYFCDFV